VRSLQSGGSGLRPVGGTTAVTVAGVRGRSVNMESTSPNADANGRSQKERDHLITIPRQDGAVIYMIFVAPEHDFDRLRPTFERILSSVQL